MDNTQCGAAGAAVPYDYRKYDQVWQRVAPSLNPYPSGIPAASFPSQAVQAAAEEEQLPGAEENPCCMGSAAAEVLEVLEGFIEDELADRRYYLAMSRVAPSRARQIIRDIAQEEGGHARRLMAVQYLITGRCYQPAVSYDRVYIGQWCSALRERYHAEACGGLNYIRASEGTTDPCLAEILKELSEDEYRHARTMMDLLEQSLSGSCGRTGMGV